MKEKYEGSKDKNTGHCKACNDDYIIGPDGILTWTKSDKQAADTFDYHSGIKPTPKPNPQKPINANKKDQ